ncbi:hypothetical protein, partial [Comamonas testosteroni]|uniref:hypothetical protein n=1 Tax=Comamonas testosteroni TaxID=285 RepID=UPI000550C936
MQKYKSNLTSVSGAAVRGASITVLDESGANATIFLDRAGTIPAGNPLKTAQDGTFEFYAANGRYSLRTDSSGLNVLEEDVILTFDPDDATDSGPIADAIQEANDAADHAQESADRAQQIVVNTVPTFGTYALAMSSLSSVQDDMLLEISHDETHSGARTRYFKRTGNVLEFSVNLDQLRLDLAEDDGSQIIGFRQQGTGAVQRTMEDKGWELRTPQDYGAKSDGLSDDSDALNKAFVGPVTLTKGLYLGNPFAVSRLFLKGIDAEIKKLDSSGNIISLDSADNSYITDIRIRANKGGNADASGHHIAVADGKEMSFSNIDILGAEGKGAGLLFYPNAIPFQERIIVTNIRGSYNRAADGDGCLVLMTKVRNSVVSNILAKEFGRFGAVE